MSLFNNLSHILVSTGLTGVLIYVFRDEIKNMTVSVINECKKYLQDRLYVRLLIKKDEHRICFALNEELNSIESPTYEVKDCGSTVNYAITDRVYKLTYNNQKIYIIVEDGLIECYSFLGNMDVLKQWINAIYEKYCSPQKQIMYYSIESNKWKFPIFRKPRQYKITKSMQTALTDVDKFISSESDYVKTGKNYKFGLLLIGEPGTGKSTTIELIATKYNMPVYIINLNTDNMNDTVLLNLLTTVPPRSIIAFEEIEKQICAIETNQSVSVTDSGILSALDGVPRLNHGVIFIATGNSIQNLRKELAEPLTRAGRIDKIYNFEEKID